MWTCVLTAPSQHCSHDYTCYYKQVAPCAITLPTGHFSTRTRSRSLSRDFFPGSLTKRQVFYVGSPTIHPMICLSELSYLFACRDMNREMQCFDTYTERCLKEEGRHQYHRLQNSTKQFNKKLCHPGPYQEGRWPDDGRG